MTKELEYAIEEMERILMKSPTIESIERIQKVVDELSSQGIDNIFIAAALSQVLADLSKKTMDGEGF